MTLLEEPKTLGDAYTLYETHLLSLGDTTRLSQTKTAVIKYTLPGLGFEIIQQDRLSHQAIEHGMKFMYTIPIANFVNALNIQKKVYSTLGSSVSQATQRTYRCVLKKMLDWFSEQHWWASAMRQNSGKYAPLIRNRRGSQQNSIKKYKATKRIKQESYALKEEQISSSLKKELQTLYAFLTEPSWHCRQDKAIRDISANSLIQQVLKMLGWLHTYKNIPLQELSLSKIVYFHPLEDKSTVKKIAKKNMQLIDEFIRWTRNERKVGPQVEGMFIRGITAVTKFLYHTETDYPDIKHYSDVPLIIFLREEQKKIKQRIAESAPVADTDKKWLEWEQFLALVKRLKEECCERTSYGSRRTERGIARSYQRYLLFAFLAYIPPDRQRTLRELEVGRTLVKENDKWYIHLRAEDYKTGSAYGEQWTLIPDLIYPELEAWLNVWRAYYKPNHNFVFSNLDGKPLSPDNVYSIFKHASYRITGKALHPHLIRSMAITYFQKQGKSDAEMASLALAMRHSRQAQQASYDRRTNVEKITPAQNMMLEAAQRLSNNV